MDYFNGDELAEDVWTSKYAQEGEITPDDMHLRMAKEFGRVNYKYIEALNKLDESVKLDKISKLSSFGKSYVYTLIDENYCVESIYNLFKDFKYVVPQGSVMAGLGSNRPVSFSNCFVIPNPEDSIEDIMNTGRDMAQIYKRRGGVGFDISYLRPSGSLVNNAANTSTGSVSFMELYSTITNTVGQQGRRGALMISIDINHPDVTEFAVIKRDLTKVTGANISVKLNNEFINAVKNDEDYFLRFPCDLDITKFSHDYIDANYNELHYIEDHENNNEICYIKKVKAKELWNTIVESNWLSAEPGIFNWEHLVDYDPTGVYDQFKPISTNPCQPKWATVLTPKGVKTFNDINIGDQIWSSEGWTKIINKQNSGVKDVFEFRTTAGSFIGTEEHKIISKNKKIKVKDAESIDLLAGNPDYSDLKEYASFIMDGLVLGDGGIHKASNNLIYLCIGENDADYFTSEVSEYIKKHRPGIKDYAYTVDTSIKYDELPLASERSIPDRYFYSNSKIVRAFLRGLYSANGSVVSKRVTFKTVSPILRDQVQILLSSLGIRSYYTTNKPKKVEFSNGEYVCKESYDINISTDRDIFYNSIGFIQTYKTDKLLTHLTDIRKSSKNHNIIETNYVSSEEVFNITVDNKSHTYWTGGLNVSNCGELGLSGYDSCRLILSNLYSLVDDPFTDKAEFNEELAYKVFYKTQILADDLVDLELEAIDRILTKINPNWEKEQINYVQLDPNHDWIDNQTEEFKLWWKVRDIGSRGRRSGTGITAYGDAMAALGLPYGDPEMTKKIFKLKLQAELDATIDMAIIRGHFPDWDLNLEFDNYQETDTEPTTGLNSWYEFILQEYPEQAGRMINNGRRNAGISTIAPAGSVSILTQTTSGVEPLFMPYYTRRKKCNPEDTPDFVDQNGVGFVEYFVLHPKFKTWFNIKYTDIDSEDLHEFDESDLQKFFEESPWYNQTSDKLDLNLRIETQALIQKYITSSISSTCNVPSTITQEEMSKGYLDAFDKGCKGLTYYRDGSRSGILVNKEEPKIIERPQSIPCRIVRFKNEKKNWIAFVGTINGKPYEIFSGVNDIDEFPIPSYVDDGLIIKIQSEERSRYDFQYVDSYGYTNTLGGLNRIFNKEYWNYARFVSALLREGTEVSNIINIIGKLEFSNRTLNSWQSGIIRALKSFIPDGTEVKGEKCLECGSEDVIYEGGCKICKNCGSTACG